MKSILAFISMLVCMSLFARGPLTLDFSTRVEALQKDPEGDSWRLVASSFHRGIGGLQVNLKKRITYRLILTADKPYNLKGTFRVRAPVRQDGLVAPAETDKVSVIFGPHSGCSGDQRCKPLNLNDIGNIELRLDLEKAKQAAFGILLFRPYDKEYLLSARPSIRHEAKEISCGQTVEKGWWIFASKAKVQSDPTRTTSLCVREPSGVYECAEDEKSYLKVRIDSSGIYKFHVWDAVPSQQICSISAR